MLDELVVRAQEYLPYLEDLRRRLYRGVVLFATLFFVGFFMTSFFIKQALQFMQVDGVTIATTSPFQVADIAMDCGFFVASLIVLPYVAYTLFSFISPGLTKKEKRKIVLIIPVSILLFLVGFLYGLAIFYYGLQFLAQLNLSLGIANIWDIGIFISQIFLTASLLGILFEFPIALTVFIRLGLFSAGYLRTKRKIAIVTVFIFVALLPPTDGISLIAMSVPLIGLYEATLLLNNKKHYVWNRN